MNYRAASFLCSLTLVLAAGCASPVDDTDDPSAADSLDLTVSKVTSFTVRQSTGFAPPPPPGSCIASGEWSVTLASQAFVADACIGGRLAHVARTLTTDELATARRALAAVRTAPRPAACPTDAPVASLDVKGSSDRYYVEQRSACGGSLAVTSASIHALVEVMKSLTSSSPAPAVLGASTCSGKPCFSVKGSCVDTTSKTQPPLRSYANIAFTYVPGPTYSALSWFDQGTLATSRATGRLGAWLRNYQGLTVDGVRRGMSPYWDGTNVSVFVTATQTATGIDVLMDTGGGANSSSCTLSATFL